MKWAHHSVVKKQEVFHNVASLHHCINKKDVYTVSLTSLYHEMGKKTCKSCRCRGGHLFFQRSIVMTGFNRECSAIFLSVSFFLISIAWSAEHVNHFTFTTEARRPILIQWVLGRIRKMVNWMLNTTESRNFRSRLSNSLYFKAT